MIELYGLTAVSILIACFIPKIVRDYKKARRVFLRFTNTMGIRVGMRMKLNGRPYVVRSVERHFSATVEPDFYGVGEQ